MKSWEGKVPWVNESINLDPKNISLCQNSNATWKDTKFKNFGT